MTPHRGGFYERYVGLTKNALQRVVALRHHKLDDEEFLTVTTLAEAMVNSRPIGILSSDAADPVALTPGHFLLGDKLRELAPIESTWPLPKRFFRLQEIMDEFWKRWVKETVPSLHRANKWFAERTNLKIGQVVIVLDEKVRGKWPLGRITAIAPSSDDRVRELEVFCRGKHFRRPVHRVLPVCL